MSNAPTKSVFTIGLALTLLIMGLGCVLLPEAALAQTGTHDISDVICSLIAAISGSGGRAIATVAIIGIGVGALFGKVSWNLAFVTAGGIALVFGGATIMTVMGLGGTSCSSNTSTFTFSCNADGTPNGNLFSVDTMADQQAAGDSAVPGSGNSCTGGNVTGIFGRALCFFKNTIGQVMSTMYCSISSQLVTTLGALLTVFVAVFGVALALGMTNFTTKEAAIFLFKIALVWAFAMNADFAIGIGYKFFMNVAEEGSNIVLSAIPSTGGTTPSITAPDAVIGGFFSAIAPNSSTFGTLPPVCIAYLIGFMVLLILFLPMVIILVIIMLLQYIGLFAECLLGYLTALVLISFLFILAPLFLSFALFRTTEMLFQKWVQYLTTFALQMIVMFGFLAFLALVPLGQFITQILNLLKVYDRTFDIYLASFAWHFCSICSYTITAASGSTPASIACDNHGGALTAEAAASAGYMLSADSQNYVISVTGLMNHGDLIAFVVAQVIALYLVSKVIEDFLKKAPQLAKALGGLPYAAALGGGGMDRSGPSINYVGIESIGAGFQGFKNKFTKSYHTRNPLKSWGRRLEAGILGEKSQTPEYAKDRWGRYLKDADGNSIEKKDKNGNVIYKREGGFVQGLLYGSSDESTLEYKEGLHALTRADADYRRAEAEVDHANQVIKHNLEKMDYARKDLEDLKTAGVTNAEILDAEKDLKTLKNTGANAEVIAEAESKIEKMKNDAIAEAQKAADLLKNTGADAAVIAQAEKKVEQMKKPTASSAAIENATEALRKTYENYHLSLGNLTARSKKLAEEQKLLLEAQNKMASHAKKGLFATRDARGMELTKSSIELEQFSKDDLTQQAMHEDERRRNEKLMYGRYLKENKDNMYYFLKMPDTVSAAQEVETMDHMRSEAESMISNLENSLEAAAHLMPADQIADIRRRIASNKSAIPRTDRASDIEHVKKDIEHISGMLSKYQ